MWNLKVKWLSFEPLCALCSFSDASKALQNSDVSKDYFYIVYYKTYYFSIQTIMGNVTYSNSKE